ncbi:MAG: hypothetical protein DMF60_16695 [Acidobacteria bacterium]|nr:MAG: hypothetical protein DMF60_16695 [Acidobacteriota bacterium]
MFKEFKESAMRGNVLDLAIGIVIGAALGKIITSFASIPVKATRCPHCTSELKTLPA